MTPTRARELLSLRGPLQGGVRPSATEPPDHPWYRAALARGDTHERGITNSEDLEVRRLWDVGPGTASWQSTLCTIAYPRCPGCGANPATIVVMVGGAEEIGLCAECGADRARRADERADTDRMGGESP